MALARFRSILLRMSFEGPRRRMVQLGEAYSVRKVKYSSQIYIEEADVCIAKDLDTVHNRCSRAIRLLSDLRTRRSTETLALRK